MATNARLLSNIKHDKIPKTIGTAPAVIDWNLSKMPSKYKKFNITGFVTQMSLEEQQETQWNQNMTLDKHLSRCSLYEIPGTIEFWETDLNQDYAGVQQLTTGRQLLLNRFPDYKPWLSAPDELEDQSELETVQKRWFQFGSSAVWLAGVERYLVVTRYMYAPSGSLTMVRCSFGKMDLYDRNWHLVENERLLYNDISGLPKWATRNTDSLRRYANERINANYGDPQIAQQRITNIMNKYSVKFPNFIDVDMDVDESVWLAGVEDPRIILKELPVEEPLVLFNMATADGNRYMHAYYPLRSKNKQIKFTINNNGDPEYMEKNWTPFFLKEDELASTSVLSVNKGFIRFIYKYNPLKILKCSLNDGKCAFVFDNYKTVYALADFKDSDEPFNALAAIRGGTQMVKLPSSAVPDLQNVNLWVTFAKTHLDNCGCGERFYRPALILYSESHGIYTQDMIIPGMDFGMDIIGWSRENKLCGGYNVLNPNSICTWDVIEQDPQTGFFNDYMTVLTSEADYRTRRVIIKGLLNFIIMAYKSKKIDENTITRRSPVISRQMFQSSIKCVSDVLTSECVKYGKTHREMI